MALPCRDLVALDAVLLGVKGTHVLDEGFRDLRIRPQGVQPSRKRVNYFNRASPGPHLRLHCCAGTLAEQSGRRRLRGRHAAGSLGGPASTAKLDRAFRSAVDAQGTPEQLKDNKIALHMIDLGNDVTGNVISKLVFTFLSAENERDLIRERVRDAKLHRTSPAP